MRTAETMYRNRGFAALRRATIERFTSAIALILVLIVGRQGIAQADDSESATTIVVDANASEDGKNPRGQALDNAFAEAVRQYLESNLTKPVQKTYKSVLRDEFIRRARIFVRSYKVTDESSSEGTLYLKVAITIKDDAISTRLSELGIETSTEKHAAPSASGSSRPAVALLLWLDKNGAFDTTFGASGNDKTASAEAFLREIRGLGFDVVSVGTAGPTAAENSAKNMPLSDDAAAELGQKSGAGGVIWVEARTKPAGAIRGTRLHGAIAEVSVRVLDDDGSLIASGKGKGAGFGLKESDAFDSAVSDAATDAMETVASAVTQFWPDKVSHATGMQIAIRGVTKWATVESVIAQVRKTPGIKRVWAQQIGGGEVVLGVDANLSVERIAAAVRATKLEDGSLQIAGKRRNQVIVEVTQ